MEKPEGHAIAIIAHVTFVGLLIALSMFTDTKPKYAGFYLRQRVGILILWIIGLALQANVNFWLGLVILITTAIFWFISLIGVIEKKKTLIPGLGEPFQNWFKFIQ